MQRVICGFLSALLGGEGAVAIVFIPLITAFIETFRHPHLKGNLRRDRVCFATTVFILACGASI
jgi:hypothetical protein